MTTRKDPEGPAAAETVGERQRRLAAIFGEVLPDSTSDDRDDESPTQARDSDAWLRAQVPPHHGGE